MTKNEIIADETLFQRVCDAYVRRHIGPCVSSLMYDVGQNLEECSRIFDFDYDEAINWFQVPDYESAVDYYVSNLDRDEVIEYLKGRGFERGDEVPVETLRETMVEDIRSEGAGGAQQFVGENDIDFDYNEIYEHWVVESSWFANELKKYGQVVFEFGGLTIFGRCTTGQSLSLDGWARSMVRDLPEDHWVWGEA
jgi:hypothetical protein